MDAEPVAGDEVCGELRSGMRPSNPNQTGRLIWKGRPGARIWSLARHLRKPRQTEWSKPGLTCALVRNDALCQILLHQLKSQDLSWRGRSGARIWSLARRLRKPRQTEWS